MDGSEFICKLCDVAVLNVFKVSGDECVELVSVCDKKVPERKERNRMSVVLRNMSRTKNFAKVDEVAFSNNVEFFREPVLSELAKRFYELGSS